MRQGSQSRDFDCDPDAVNWYCQSNDIAGIFGINSCRLGIEVLVETTVIEEDKVRGKDYYRCGALGGRPAAA